MYSEIFEQYGHSGIEALDWKQKSKVITIAREKAKLRANPDYIRPTYALIFLCFLVPLAVWLVGLNIHYVVTSFILMGWLMTYLTTKLAKPYLFPFLDEAFSEFREESNKL